MVYIFFLEGTKTRNVLNTKEVKMKKLLLALVATTMAGSVFAHGHNMVRMYGWDGGARNASFDFSMEGDDASEAEANQRIAINYARAFGEWQVGIVYKSVSTVENSNGDETAGTTTGLSFYYNTDSDLKNTNYWGFHYLMHAASDGTYNADELREDLGEDDTATSIILEYGHRWAVGSGWGFHVSYAPSVMYNMSSYSYDSSANDDSQGAAETSLSWNFLKFDVMF